MEFQQGLYQKEVPGKSLQFSHRSKANTKTAQKKGKRNMPCLNGEQSPLTGGIRFRSVCRTVYNPPTLSIRERRRLWQLQISKHGSS